ncbi:hypothetical protein C0Q70_20749 [Pomacea canaliculata]|uniref:Uncharacterized protein n=1 Tax=Pomacea canaliculata TaxID=400727 RepID=A0A2T7NGI8_POMCA|nr:hypothetical protein C0Q70_20749 [Pomacea canaliculata]
MATEGCRQTPAMAPAVLWPHHSPHCAGMMSFSRLCANTRYPQTRTTCALLNRRWLFLGFISTTTIND